MGSLAIQPNSKRAYALALALFLAALALQWMLRPVVGSRVPFIFFFPAIGIAAMWGGWKPAVLVLAGGFINALFWLEPAGQLTPDSPEGYATLTVYLLYVLAGAFLLALGGRVSELRARAVEAETGLADQVKDLEALHELSTRVTLLPTLPEQLQAIVQTLCALQEAQKGIVWLYQADSDRLHVAASVGFSEQGLKDLSDVPVGEGACGLAYASRAAAIVEDTEEDEHFAPYRSAARREGFRAVHSRPLIDRHGQVFGAVSIHFAQRRLPSQREQRLGDLCARMASVLAERDAALKQAMALSSRLEVALDTSAVPFCLLQPMRDAAGNITTFRWEYLNAAAARVLGRPATEVTGRGVRDFLGGASLEPGLLGRALQALQSGKTVQFETWVDLAGNKRWFQVIASPYEQGLAVWFSDVTTRKRHEQELREADRRKDEFLATLAHELRNPLAPIRQAALIAKSPAASDAQKRWSYEVIERQVGHMAVLLDDLLDVSRITRGKLELRKSVIDLRGVVDAALESARPQIESRKQHLRTLLPDTPLWLDADPMRMAQVLSNLLTNASKYTPAEGHIELAARAENGEVVIAVRDDGRGIAPESLERIFEMFTQVRTEDAASATGLGIGLALSRGLVQLHGGQLSAASPGLGMGSTFSVRLPLAAQPQQAQQEAPAEQANGRARRVLVADDNRDAAQSMADLLRMEGHEVALAFDGQQALAEFGRFAPEIALLDIGMPGMTGNAVATAIRARPEGANTVLVAITGWGQERDRHAAREAGFDFHFTKPVDPLQVLSLLDRTPERTG
jgi:PAS domain S-box-containing protein